MLKILKYTLAVAVTIVTATVVSGCHSVDDNRIPMQPVSISFQTMGQWDIYGVPGAMMWNRFIRSERIPANFPYTELTYTGFGGILLVCDVLGNPQAYDLSCPVECRQNIRVFINEDIDVYMAECPECGSRYDVFSLNGHPVSGIAADRGYALRKYRVGPGRGGDYMVVSY